MIDQQDVAALKDSLAKWEKEASDLPERQAQYVTTSGVPIERVYTPAHIANLDYKKDLGLPGKFPYTRGVHHNGYRGRLWTMRMFSGFGTAEDSNARYKYLLEHGESGLSVAFDYPTLMGRDSDDPLSVGEFGKCGVAISSLADIEILFDGIPVDKITTSMTINGPAAVIWAMYIAAAEKRGYPMSKLGGTIQNDILKEYIAQNSYIFPPTPSLRLIVDTFEFGCKHLPLWNTISISGYHIREAGATAVQELAFTLADGFTYVKAGIERGLDIDIFAPRLSFFFNSHNDFFEEIAKFRAARRIWAKEMKDRFGAKNERSLWLRFHTQTAGCSLTAQQVESNIARTTWQALAAVLGGTQSLHTNSMDEAWALPSEKAVRIALRTQQLIAAESGVANTVDPLGGSFFVEALTNQTEQAAYDYFNRIEALGGVIPAIEKGFFQMEIARSAYRYQKEIDTHQRTVVGVNDYVIDEPISIPLLEINAEGERHHLERLNRVRRERDNRELTRRLKALEKAARGQENLMPYILEAVRAYGTLGEICGVFRNVFGEYEPRVLI